MPNGTFFSTGRGVVFPSVPKPSVGGCFRTAPVVFLFFFSYTQQHLVVFLVFLASFALFFLLAGIIPVLDQPQRYLFPVLCQFFGDGQFSFPHHVLQLFESASLDQLFLGPIGHVMKGARFPTHQQRHQIFFGPGYSLHNGTFSTHFFELGAREFQQQGRPVPSFQFIVGCFFPKQQTFHQFTMVAILWQTPFHAQITKAFGRHVIRHYIHVPTI